jgi:Na+-driven multidrug efflux pump
MPVFGVTQSMQSIAGYNFGAQQWDRVKKVVRLTLKTTIIWMTLGIGIVLLFRSQLVGLFEGENSNSAMMELAERILRIHAPPIVLFGLVFVTGTLLISTGQYVKSLLFNMSRQLVFELPLIVVLPIFMGLDGVIYSIPVSDTCVIIMASIVLWRQWKKIGRMQ